MNVFHICWIAPGRHVLKRFLRIDELDSLHGIFLGVQGLRDLHELRIPEVLVAVGHGEVDHL